MKFTRPLYEDDEYEAPRTLGEWVKNFRIKKMQMKRKIRSGGNLRVCAMLATALLSAEQQLRLKQQERLNRCIQLQPEFYRKMGVATTRTMQCNENEKTTLAMCCDDNGVDVAINIDADDNDECKRHVEITNLWKEELNGLDEFMRKMSSSNSNNSNNYSHHSCARSIKVSS